MADSHAAVGNRDERPPPLPVLASCRTTAPNRSQGIHTDTATLWDISVTTRVPHAAFVATHPLLPPATSNLFSNSIILPMEGYSVNGLPQSETIGAGFSLPSILSGGSRGVCHMLLPVWLSRIPWCGCTAAVFSCPPAAGQSESFPAFVYYE